MKNSKLKFKELKSKIQPLTKDAQGKLKGGISSIDNYEEGQTPKGWNVLACFCNVNTQCPTQPTTGTGIS
ncbi:hypothetical protein [Chryseobacterium sp. KMC2]|uniref:hypothetical protein n=1 Tax=Chryseobacterium sp. KMC2 TaxID=2800705 RepID=UPI00192219F3|nr:hypothetical protein [Chryseobacterium sp. KMC2]MBL3550554.1 hypothetical protein [Chryseobacterium sp. KMC2]